MKNLLLLVVAALASLGLLSCSSTNAKSNRVVASTYDCPAETSAFEDLLAKYNSCKYGGSGCSDFCGGAAPLARGGVGPRPGEPAPPVDVCALPPYDPARRAQERRDLDATAMSYKPVVAYGRNMDDCVDAALASTEAFNLEQSCDSKAMCLKNCSAEVRGSASRGDLRPGSKQLDAEVGYKNCELGTKPEICHAACKMKLENQLAKHANECGNNRLGVSSCTGKFEGDIINIRKGNEFHCKVRASFTPDNVNLSCEVALQAINKPEYRGRRRR